MCKSDHRSSDLTRVRGSPLHSSDDCRRLVSILCLTSLTALAHPLGSIARPFRSPLASPSPSHRFSNHEDSLHHTHSLDKRSSITPSHAPHLGEQRLRQTTAGVKRHNSDLERALRPLERANARSFKILVHQRHPLALNEPNEAFTL